MAADGGMPTGGRWNMNPGTSACARRAVVLPAGWMLAGNAHAA